MVVEVRDMKATKEVKVEAGKPIEIFKGNKWVNGGKINRIVENVNRNYIVANKVWRSFQSYGTTWRMKNEEIVTSEENIFRV